MFKVKPQDWLILKNEKKKTSIDWAAEVYCEGRGKGLSLCGFPLALMSLCFTCKSDWLCIIHFELRCSLLINPGCRGKASVVCFYALAFSLLRLQGYPVLHFMLDQSCSVKKINSLNKNQGVHNWSVKAMQCLSIQNLFIFPQNPLNIFPPVQIGIALPWFCTSSFSSLMGLKKPQVYWSITYLQRNQSLLCKVLFLIYLVSLDNE